MLTVLLSDDDVFTDITIKMESFLRDSLTHSFVAIEDYIYVGYYKPIDQFFVDFSTVSTETHTVTLEYYDGSDFSELTIKDYTNDFSRSGFIKWTKPTDEEKTTVDSVELYWYRLSLSADSTEDIVITGISNIFCDDFDLSEIDPVITDYLPPSKLTFAGFHQSARNEIIQRLNNSGNFKLSSGSLTEINIYDLLDISEFKEAAKYLTASKIFESMSDQVNDNFSVKSERYKSLYESSFNLYAKTIDSNDNGTLDSGESNRVNFGRIILV